jgi:hypothetical protein
MSGAPLFNTERTENTDGHREHYGSDSVFHRAFKFIHRRGRKRAEANLPIESTPPPKAAAAGGFPLDSGRSAVLARRQLKSTRNDSRNRDVLVKLLPAQGETVKLKLDLRKLLLACGLEQTKPICRKTEDPTIMQLAVYRPSLCPGSQRRRFNSDSWINGGGIH